MWQQQQMQGGHLSHGRMLATAGAMRGGRLTHEQQAIMHVAGGIPSVHHPQLYWLPPQMVSTQLQMHQQHQQHPQHSQHSQHHDVGGYNGRSPLQPAQLGPPPPLACADALSDAHISEQVMQSSRSACTMV